MLSKEYWNNRYKEENTPWNVGTITTPLKVFIDSLEDKNLDILIPGAGHGHEAVYLHQKGFKNVFICDWAPEAIELFKNNFPDFPASHLICGDFFELDINVDLIIEQTFFCAIYPAQRIDYAKKAAALLRKNGRLAGLLFAEEFDKEGPPFGGTKKEYQTVFKPYFKIETMEISPHSIQPRAQRELFVVLTKLSS